MLGSVPTAPRSIEEYRPIVGDEVIEELRSLADNIKGARVLNVNATAFGGGVAEILGTMVPLMNDVGLKADWQVITGADEFFEVTKSMHNSLQGMYHHTGLRPCTIWLRYNTLNAGLFDEDYDFVVIHDPQQRECLARSWSTARFAGRQLGVALPYRYNGCPARLVGFPASLYRVFTMRPFLTLKDFVKDDLQVPNIALIPPAIDPLSSKNSDMAPEMSQRILKRYGVDINRPFLLQVSRFDPWKDPLGVIDAYRIVKDQMPEMQLVMVASMASDDPEGWAYFERTARRAGEEGLDRPPAFERERCRRTSRSTPFNAKRPW